MTNSQPFQPLGVPAPAPATRFTPILWTPQNGRLDLTLLDDVWMGFRTHWIPDGDREKTVPCVGATRCIYCKSSCLVPQWSGYISAIEHHTKRPCIYVLTPSAVAAIGPHCAKGLRGCAFSFSRVQQGRGRPVTALFLARHDATLLPAAPDKVAVLARVWKVRDDVLRRLVGENTQTQPATWAAMQEPAPRDEDY